MRGAAIRIAVVLAALGATTPVDAQTLSDALVLAYQNSPRIASERARLRATDEGVNQALSFWRPQVVINGNAAAESNNLKAANGGGSRSSDLYPYSGSISIDQNIYRGGRTLAATRQAENLVRAERAQLSSVEQQVLLDATTAYMDVVRDQAVVELSINNERVLQRQLEATRDRFRVGEVTRTDVAQAESRLALGTTNRITSQGTLAGSRARFANVIGATPQKLQDVPPIKELPADMAETLDLARRKAFGVISADYTERAARDQVRLTVGELLPQVTVSGSAGRSVDPSIAINQSDSLSVTGQVRVPLYQSGSVSSRIREAKQTVAQRRDERNQAVRDAVQQATLAWEALETARSQVRSFGDEVRAARIALEGVRQEALVGSRTVLDVLNAEQELFTARVDLVGARHDLVVATYRVRAAVGQLTAASLGLPVKYYDPTKNYRRVRGKWFGTGIAND